MKKYIIILSAAFLVSCVEGRGPAGPEGPQGPQGPAGPVGQAYEVQASFNEGNDYSVVSTFPQEMEVLETDVIAVYLLWEVDQNTGNDVWQPLPASVFFNDGELQYGFDHTVTDVKLFLTGDTDLSTVSDDFTQDQIFRVAVLPVDYVEANDINMASIQQVMSAIGSQNIQRMQLY